MEKIHGNMHVFVLSCEFLTSKHQERIRTGGGRKSV